MSYRLFGTPPSPYNLRALKEQAVALDGFLACSAVNAGAGPPDEQIVFKFEEGALTTQQDVDTFLAGHNGSEPSLSEVLEQVTASGEQTFANLPGWATWTVAEGHDYIDTDVIDLATAKVVMKAFWTAIVALRNAQWPGLQG